jgi:hypothetical protein
MAQAWMVHDTRTDPDEASREYGTKLLRQLPQHGAYDSKEFAVAHRDIVQRGVQLRSLV